MGDKITNKLKRHTTTHRPKPVGDGHLSHRQQIDNVRRSAMVHHCAKLGRSHSLGSLQGRAIAGCTDLKHHQRPRRSPEITPRRKLNVITAMRAEKTAMAISRALAAMSANAANTNGITDPCG
ncbi:hypothetical protein Ajs_0722 [Acidovorax sp. JS42]|nr:hypothetical protein Ajs_0722 [Acidovorax sp. JS42]